MLQSLDAQDILRRFNVLAGAIGQASQTCSADRNVPSELRVCIQKLDQQSDQLRAVLQARDEGRLRKMVDALDQLSERARLVCANGANITPHMRVAVVRVHDEVAALKQQVAQVAD